VSGGRTLFDHDATCAVCFDPLHNGRVCGAPDMPYVDPNGDEHPMTCPCDESISIHEAGKRMVVVDA
jgi:hypothetical protein